MKPPPPAELDWPQLSNDVQFGRISWPLTVDLRRHNLRLSNPRPPEETKMPNELQSTGCGLLGCGCFLITAGIIGPILAIAILAATS